MPKVSSYTVQKKLQVVQWHRNNGSNVSRTSREFKIDRKRIREWVQQENVLQQNNFGEKKFCRKLSNGRAVLSEELDDSLFEFFQEQREKGLAVSNRQLAEEALTIAKRLGLADFKASTHYLARWKARFSVSMRKGTSESQKLPEDYAEAASAFLSAVKDLRQKNDYSLYNICNMDQTMVRYDAVANRTNNLKGENSIRIANTGCRKRGFTVALAARASGHKLPAMLIFKEPSGKIPAKAFAKLKIPENVKVTSSVNGWMTTEKMGEWLSRIWKDNEDDVRRLLVLDQAPIHKVGTTQQDIAARDTDLVLIPAGCTSILQPADVCWIKPFKAHMMTSWADYIKLDLRTPAGNLKSPGRQEMIDFVSKAWAHVSMDCIEKSFKVCGISVVVDGSENGFFHEKLANVDPALEEEDLMQECVDILFDSDSEESFAGFSDVD